ncbi:MAG TPA: glycosyltransferase family 2 protein [Verrucomicrobiae bacterium]|nr:glycosyltransferase family 2 protein [Verrucomicrobiae bacterium]
MKSAYERTEAELIADLEDEATMLQHRNVALELEVKELRRDLRRVRRNVGYRIVNGVARALERMIHGSGRSIHFPKPARNGPGVPCSAELKTLLEELYVAAAFFTSPSQRNWSLHKHLLRKRCSQLCFGQEEFDRAVTSFFAVPENSPAPVQGPSAFAHHDLIVIDWNDPGTLWPLIKGRLWPHQKVLLHGKDLPHECAGTETGPDFVFYAAPPPPWLDPRHSFLPRFAPWKSTQRRLPAKLPSGNSWPKISVVTPSFNQGKFITDTFESVLGQKYPNLEYLVLDGGSTDETRMVLDQYRPRLAYSCSQKDNGQADAINKGFARATGDILAWLNSDDQYATDALMHVAAAFDLFPEADVVVGGCGLVESAGSALSQVHHPKLPIGRVVPLPLARLLDVDNCWLKGHFFYQPEVFWRRRIWEAAGAHVLDDLYYCFDYDLWVRMAQAGAKVIHIPDLLALYRVHPAQKTYGDNLPYLPELRLVKSRRDPSAVPHETVGKA